MKKYAGETKVSVDRSEMEIRKIVSDYGADQFISANKPGCAVIGFKLKDRVIRITLPLAQKNSSEFHPMNYTWGDESSKKENRARWRALVLDVKAKLVSISSGIRTVEQAFYYDVVMPGGKTIGEQTAPFVAQAYLTGKDVKLLEGF